MATSGSVKSRMMHLGKILFVYISMFSFDGLAQSNRVPKEGCPMPSFQLLDVDYYIKDKFTNSDLVGKWTVLDFWSKTCVNCIRSFPRLNKLQEEFKSDVQFLLIAQNDIRYNSHIRDIYEKYRKRMSLDFIVAYDSVLTVQFGVEGFPHTIIVDPKGVVYAITSSESVTESKLKELIENQNPKFKRKYSKYDLDSVARDSMWKYYIDEDGQLPKDVILRSTLTKYDGEMVLGSPTIEDAKGKGIYQCTKQNLYKLYNIAYFGRSHWGIYDDLLYGRYWMIPVLEMNDTSLFNFNYAEDTGFYNYSIFFPEASADVNRLKDIMKTDLFNCFGYKVNIETRQFPCWKLTATEAARKSLPAKEGERLLRAELTSFSGKNISLSKDLLTLLAYYNFSYKNPIPFIDETGITGNVDLEFKAVISDFGDVRDKLKKVGLNFEIVKREMQVLIIRE